MKKGRDGATLREYQTALQSAREELPALIAVYGENEYLRTSAVSALRLAWFERYPEGDVALLRGSGEARVATLADITGELSGGSLFAREKLVVVRQAEKILFPSSSEQNEAVAASGKAGEREKAFFQVLEKPSARTWLVLESSQLPKNRNLGKRISEYCRLIPCPQPTPRDIPDFLHAKARELGHILDDAAADLLHRAYGVDLGILSTEMEKLALFAGEGAPIDAAMVGEFLTGTIEFDIFGFTNAVESRDSAQALFYARRIAMQGTRDQKGKKEDGEKSAHKVVAMLSTTLQNLLRARAARATGISSAEFASSEKLSPWRAEKLMEASGRFSLRELRQMVSYAADQVRRSHDTGSDVTLSLELMAVRFTCPEALL